ncbi:MAG TPA: T3SS effector HopA1 family protein [Jatrophihabitans sp.]|jgi:hypothetical protein|nr:T3SS effector HopA1 family protein [Jatrophihabitans sp.]
MASEMPSSGAVLAGGKNGAPQLDESIVSQRPAADDALRGSAAGPWPAWAGAQLSAAVAIAESASDRMSVAALLYREWFNPIAGEIDGLPANRPLAGVYRTAHAGSTTRVRSGGVSVVGRHDVIRTGGWWRTWGEDWTPPRSRPGSVRLMLTPRPDRLAEFVTTVTGRLLDECGPWSLACAVDPRRIARVGCAVLDLQSVDAVPSDLLDELTPLLRPIAPPLCLPLAAGVGAAEYPDNGMTFGEHRCHLVALALRHPSSARNPLRAVAAVFAAHGLDPTQPHQSRQV